jgi:ABC-type multidrug transport system fused ATPase/permease subunit
MQADDRVIEAALKIANAYEFVKDLPKEYTNIEIAETNWWAKQRLSTREQ